MSGSDTETMTVHSVTSWTLQVNSYGVVTAAEDPDPYEYADGWTTRGKWWAPEGRQFRYGKTIEEILARYAHETRFERDAEEHGAALRDGVIKALQSVAMDAVCGRGECHECATHVHHVNAPTGPKTALVCDEHATAGEYVTNYVLDGPEQAEPQVTLQ